MKELLPILSRESKADLIIDEDLRVIQNDLLGFTPKVRNKTFFITGGAGFLGSWFSETAISMGGKVICVDNFAGSSQSNIDRLKRNQNFRFIQTDAAKIKIPPNVDYVIHMASIASPPLCEKNIP